MVEILDDVVPWGLALVDETGEVHFLNQRGREIMSRGDGLELKEGRIRASRSSADRCLQTLIRSAAQTPDDVVEALSVLSIPGPENAVLYAVRVHPYLAENRTEKKAALVITELNRGTRVPRSILARLFSLSPREAHFAEIFGAGSKLAEAAKAMDISINTARVHLHNVFHKTGTHNQVELARLLSRLAV